MDKKNQKKSKRLYRTYGITLVEWNELYIKQNGACAVCKTLPPSGRLSVDHMHQKGFKKMTPEQKKRYVRGLCCFLCNTAIGKLERTNDAIMNRKRFNGLIMYFMKYPMKGELDG